MMLQPAPIAVHQPEHAPPPLRMADVVGDDVEAIPGHRRSPRHVVRHLGDLARDVPRQQAALHGDEAAHRDAVTHIRKDDEFVADLRCS